MTFPFQPRNADSSRDDPHGKARSRPLEVAIIGGGLVGLALAVGLHARAVRFTLYERVAAFGELGVGITIVPNGERALAALDPRLEEYLKMAQQVPLEYLNIVDAFCEREAAADDARTSIEDLIFQLRPDEGFRALRRSDLLDAMVKLVPSEHVRLGMCLQSVQTPQDGRRTILTFRDGSTAEADVVVGCDGIRSGVRSLMFGVEPGRPRAQYSHQLGFRSIVPLLQATAVLGPAKTSTPLLHTGPGGFIISFPLPAPVNALHIEAFIADPGEWPEIDTENDTKRYVLPATRREVEAAFAGFGPTARALVALLPDKVDKWAVFDMLDAPVPSLACGALCLAGDAAHATTPNHGGGASVGFEDVLVLAEVLANPKPNGVAQALQMYSDMRHARSLWLVESSRRLLDILSWKDTPNGVDKEKVSAELHTRSHTLWDYDIVRETADMVQSNLVVAS
nr:SorC [Stagonospora sp.]